MYIRIIPLPTQSLRQSTSIKYCISVIMKVLSLSLLLQLAIVEGFTTSVRVVPSSSAAAASAIDRPLKLIQSNLYHHLGDIEHDMPLLEEDDNSAVDNTAFVLKKDDAKKMAMKVVAALALAAMSWGIATTPPAFAATTATDDSSFLTSSTSVVLSASSAVKDSDIADFSMPSYEAASRAEVNSNLKGESYLLGEASKDFMTSSR